jgi:hypothetical protein
MNSMKKTSTFRKFLITDERLEMRKFDEGKILGKVISKGITKKITDNFKS